MPTQNAPSQSDSSSIDESLKYLSSPELKGRLAGTEDADKAGLFISEQFNNMGFQAVFQNVQCYSVRYVKEDSRWVLKLTDETKQSRNIIAEKPGSNPEKIIVAAHYDHIGENNGTVFTGANDNASGISVLLETARQVKGQPEGKYSLVLAALTGEEQGYLGSKELLQSMSDQPLVLINLDCMGNSDGHFAISGHPGRYMPALEKAAKEAGVNLLYLDKDDDDYMYSDHEPFIQEGYPAFTIHTESWRRRIHTAADTYENTPADSLRQAADFVISLLKQIQSL